MGSQELKTALDLLQHAALLVCVAMGYSQLRQWLLMHLPPRVEALLYGAVFGLLGVIGVLTPVELPGGGVTVDLHIAAVLISSLFAGVEAGIAAAAIVSFCLIYAGNPHLLVPYVLTMAVAVALGVLDANYRRRQDMAIGWRDLIGLGIAIATVGPVLITVWPESPVSLAVILANVASWIVLVVLTVLMLGGSVLHFERGRALTQALRESEQRFRSFYHETPVMLTATDGQGRIVAVSESWLQKVGYRRDEVIGRSRWDFISPASAGYVRDVVLPNLKRTRAVQDIEYQLLRKDGAFVDVCVDSILRRDRLTGADETLSFFIDQTARKQAERTLEAREREFGAIMDNAPMAIFLKDRGGRFRLINRCYTEWFGDRPEDVYGRTVAELYSPFIVEGSEKHDRQVLEDGQVAEWERPIEQAKPGIEYVLETKFPIRDDSGSVAGLAGFISDITGRKRAEIALRESRELLIESQRLGKVGYILADLSSNRVYWSDSLFELRGVARREFFAPGEGLQLLHPEDRAKYLAARNAAVAARRDFEIDVRPRRADGSYGWEHIVGHPRFDDSGNLASILLVMLDITEAKRVEEIIRWSEERFRALLENSNDIIVVVQPDGTISYRAPSIAEGLGYAAHDIIGHQLLDFVHPDDIASVAGTLRTIATAPGLDATGQCRLLHQDGSWRHIAWSARNATHIPGIEGIIVNCHDVTGARLLEEQLHQSQKMEAVGQLAGGIAHDFNNIIGAILGFAGFLRQDLPAGTPQHGFANRIVLAGERARDLVHQILAFSRRSTVERRSSDLVAIVRDTRDLLEASLPSSTKLVAVLGSEPMVAEVNAAQIAQILLNLCLNANDALAGEPGRVDLILSRIDPGAADYALFSGERARAEGEESEERVAVGMLDGTRSYACLTIADTGSGIEPAVLSRIFDPFFTTKVRGRGTGLGLSVVHGLVMAYQGACTVLSRVGAGATFTIYLPLAASEIIAPTISAKPAVIHGRERVLVVDDEIDMTDMLTIGLDRLGYETVALNDPAEALAMFIDDPGAWDVVISDQVMPGMKGLTLFDRLKAVRPELRFILCTGFSDGATEELALAAGVDAFFLKPVSPEQLAACVRRLVDRAA